MRKIIQIAAAGAGTGPTSDELELSSELYALCDDGTLWMLIDSYTGWKPIKPIPQDPGED